MVMAENDTVHRSKFIIHVGASQQRLNPYFVTLRGEASFKVLGDTSSVDYTKDIAILVRTHRQADLVGEEVVYGHLPENRRAFTRFVESSVSDHDMFEGGAYKPAVVATDVETGVASQGKTREKALQNLDEAVALRKGEIGQPVTDDDLRAWGIDPDEIPENPEPLPDFLQ
jgi:hypothetical protein